MIPHHVKIYVDQLGAGTVIVDGHEINAVSIGFNAGVDELTEVTIVIPAAVVEIDTHSVKLTLVERKQP